MKDFLQNNWAWMVLALWFGHKWWRSHRVRSMLPELRQAGALLLDVRSVGEYGADSAPGTVNIPLPELGARLAEIPRDKPVVVGCASGTRSGMARMLLRKNGYAQVHNIGSWRHFMN